MKEDKEKLIKEMFKKGVLVSADMIDNHLDDSLIKKIENENDLMVLNSDYAEIITKQTSLVDWHEIDKFRVEAEKERNDDLYQNQLQQFKKSSLIINFSEKNNHQEQEIVSLETGLDLEKSNVNFNLDSEFKDESELSSELEMTKTTNTKVTNTKATNIGTINTTINTTGITDNNPSYSVENQVEIVISYENKPYKYEIKDFANIFRSRYHFLEKILRNRQELQGTLTINRLQGKKDKEKVSIIGLVDDISTTKNGHIIVTLEDLTGKIKVLISKNNPELLIEAKDLVVDEVIGVAGTSGEDIIFSEKIIWPDVPATNEMKKNDLEEYALFLSDIHYGSNVFLKKEFEKFLRWINGTIGNETQQELAKKVKYIFIAGDLVDGVGEYPSQEEDLEIKDIYQQYEGVAGLLKQIPRDKQIIICPGNHDMMHLAEPQPVFYREYAATLLDLPNITFVTNPGLVNIAKTDKFSGFDVLMYHGFSFDYYVANVESIRNEGGYHRADLIMKLLLKKRHLAPSFKSTPYFPGHQEDPLLIKKIPDFFLTGHIHYSKVANYKGITMICGSCWQGMTSFQEKMGHEPEPARVPLVNLKTRDVKILKFV